MLGYGSFCRNGGAEGISGGREGKERGGAPANTVGSGTDERDKGCRWGGSDCLCLRSHDCGWLCGCDCVCDGGGDVDEGGIENGYSCCVVIPEGYFVGDEDRDAGVGGDGNNFGTFRHAGGEGYGRNGEIGHGRLAE